MGVVMGVTAVITGIDSMKILRQATRVASSFRPLSEPELQALRDRAQPAAARGEFELFKTSNLFDATAEHPEWTAASHHAGVGAPSLDPVAVRTVHLDEHRVPDVPALQMVL